MIFCYFREWSCISLGSHIFARHLASLIHQSAVSYGRCAFLHFFQKSCPKCFKKRFKSRSRWRLILGLNPSFGGFFLKIFKNWKSQSSKRRVGNERVYTSVVTRKNRLYSGGGREGGREEALGFHSTLQKRCASRNNTIPGSPPGVSSPKQIETHV